MSLKASQGAESPQKKLDEPGLYKAVCCRIYDLGTQESKEYNNQSRKVLFGFETEGLTYEWEGETRKVIKWKEFTCSLHEKSNMRPFLENWRGRSFTGTELVSFDLKTVLGANCYLNLVIEESKQGKKYLNIGGISPVKSSEPKIDPENALVCFDIEENSIPKNTQQWIQDKINNSLEMRNGNTGQTAQSNTDMGHAGEDVPVDSYEPVEDEIPF